MLELALSIAERGAALVNGPRQAAYGEPVNHLTRVGELWGALLDAPPIPPHLVAEMMVGLKLLRYTHTQTLDSLIDAHGYLELAERCGRKRRKK